MQTNNRACVALKRQGQPVRPPPWADGLLKLIMKKLLQRKRIWEVDCVSLDAALAASFDWQDLANMLEAHGGSLNHQQPEEVLELQAQNGIHQKCHDPNDVSLKIEQLLNQWHEDAIEQVNAMEMRDILFLLPAWAEKNEISWGGAFWALGTDAREGLNCLRRHFFQRLQIRSVRNMKSQAAVWK